MSGFAIVEKGLLLDQSILGFLSGPVTDPVGVFLIIMAIMLVAPLVFERFRLPGIVGLILAGVLVGPNGLGILQRDNTIVLLGTVGLLFLMFMAGLETSLDDLKYNANKAIGFGMATFFIPMAMGTAAFLLLGYGWLASILVASCFASHTLLALPIVSKLGIMRSPVVTATLGGTLITNVFALLVLAVVVKAHQGDLTLGFWLFLIPSLVLYTFATLWGVPRVGRWFFRRFGHDEGAEFLFVVATLFVASYVARLIEIEPIIGAFLAGIAITQLIPQLSPLMNRIQFIGNTLFVPFFLISVGMLVNPGILIQEPQSLLVAVVMVIVAIAAKLLPAWGTGKLFGYDMANIMTMFGLSVAQAASTLAAITVAFNIELVDQLTVNGTIVMILVTCLLSPWVTDRWGRQVKATGADTKASKTSNTDTVSTKPAKYRILVPVANPNTEDNLLQLGILLAKQSQGTLLPLHVLLDQLGPISVEEKIRQDQLLANAESIAHAAVTDVNTIGRVDDSIDKGILRASQENNASLIICGWKGHSNYRDNFFGSVIDNVVRRSPIPVLVSRFTHPIKTTRRVVLAIADTGYGQKHFNETLTITNTLATELKAKLEVVQVTSSASRSPSTITIPETLVDVAVQQLRGNFVARILQLITEDDLLVLIADSDMNLPGLPVLGNFSEAIARSSRQVSILIIHYPS
ncbi:cation:proton antiporter [Leptolyngbya sp. AN02str]|uniref:cation:proton antiporter domain-containing protein n=1 Tax=Leptolyngbya sp. AN02str TaxID=3423363 RepID=UPI003D321915